MTQDDDAKHSSEKKEEPATDNSEQKHHASSSSTSGGKQAGDSKEPNEGATNETVPEDPNGSHSPVAPRTPETPPHEPMTGEGGSGQAFHGAEIPDTPASVATASSDVERKSQRRRRRGFPEGFPIKPPGMPGFSKTPQFKPNAA